MEKKLYGIVANDYTKENVIIPQCWMKNENEILSYMYPDLGSTSGQISIVKTVTKAALEDCRLPQTVKKLKWVEHKCCVMKMEIESLNDANILLKYFNDATDTPKLYAIVETIEKKLKMISVVPDVWLNVEMPNEPTKSKEVAKLMFPNMNFGKKSIFGEIIDMAIKDCRKIESLTWLKFKQWDCYVLKAGIDTWDEAEALSSYYEFNASSCIEDDAVQQSQLNEPIDFNQHFVEEIIAECDIFTNGEKITTEPQQVGKNDFVKLPPKDNNGSSSRNLIITEYENYTFDKSNSSCEYDKSGSKTIDNIGNRNVLTSKNDNDTVCSQNFQSQPQQKSDFVKLPPKDNSGSSSRNLIITEYENYTFDKSNSSCEYDKSGSKTIDNIGNRNVLTSKNDNDTVCSQNFQSHPQQKSDFVKLPPKDNNGSSSRNLIITEYENYTFDKSNSSCEYDKSGSKTIDNIGNRNVLTSKNDNDTVCSQNFQSQPQQKNDFVKLPPKDNNGSSSRNLIITEYENYTFDKSNSSCEYDKSGSKTIDNIANKNVLTSKNDNDTICLQNFRGSTSGSVIQKQNDCDCCVICKGRFENITKALNEHIVLMKTVLHASQNIIVQSNDETNFSVEEYFNKNLPIKNQDEAIAFELFLKENSNLKPYVWKKLSVLGGLNEKIFVSRALEKIFSVECLTQLTWGGTKDKIGFNTMVNINEVLISAGQKAFPNASAIIVQIIEKTIRNKIKNSNAKLQYETARLNGEVTPRAEYFKKKYAENKTKNKHSDDVQEEP